MTTTRKSPAFSFYPDSWVGGTRRMSLIEKAIYIELLADQWCNGPFTLAMACRVCAEANHETVEAVVMAKFSQDENGLFFNKRLEQERSTQQERRDRQRQNGLKGGRPKAGENPNETQVKPKNNQLVNPNETQTEHKKNPSVSVSVSVSDLVSDSISVSENSHTHTPRARRKFETEEFEPEWTRWCEFRFAIDGREIPEPQVETLLMDLGRRGSEKAKRDIEFSIRKSAKSILDSDNDFESRARNGPSANGYRVKKSMTTAELLEKEKRERDERK